MPTAFPPLHADIRRALEALPRALDAALPLNAAHHRDLPLAVEELSTRLTSDRAALHKPYWSAPRLTSAYLRYFLPWNLIRLTRLFGGLELPPPTPLASREGAAPAPRLVVDLGSGPLSVPLALWLAYPQWRTLPLTVLCLDTAPRPLELGRRIFAAVAGEDAPWRIISRRAPADALLREVRGNQGIPWLLTAANVLNELKSHPGQESEDRLANILEQTAQFLAAPDASALFIEPGTRLGGKTIADVRELALNAGLFPTQPCPHAEECPLQHSRTWCHFTFDAQDAPAWLTALSQSSHLNKDSLSLAFILLRPGTDAAPAQDRNARIVSAPFRVPGLPGLARYACTARGLAVMADAAAYPSGALLDITWPEQQAKDRKSGAWIFLPQHYKGERMAVAEAPIRPAAPPRAQTRTPRPQRPAAPHVPGMGKRPADRHSAPKPRKRSKRG